MSLNQTSFRTQRDRTGSSDRSHIRMVMLIVIAVVPVRAIACGPFFPNRILLGSDKTLTSAPVADFTHELSSIAPRNRPPEKAVQPKGEMSVYRHTAVTEVSELTEALRHRGVADAKADSILVAYRKYRDALQAFRAARSRIREKNSEPKQVQIGQLPEGLPGEFADYLTGATAYHQGDLPGARRAWLNLLARPEAQRKYRSVWAAYMLGRSYVESDAEKAVTCFAYARKLAADGFRDALGLAAASYGWEGKAWLHAGRFDHAIEMYITQRATGDSTANASLMLVASQALAKGDKALHLCAANESARQVITAYVLSQGGAAWASWSKKEQDIAKRWIAVIESSDRDGGVKGAERLAWMAYQLADYDTATRWVARAGDKLPIALWVRSKLLLRAGKIDDALRTLALAVKRVPADEVWSNSNWQDRGRAWFSQGALAPRGEMLAEMGALQLTRGQYVEALALLLDSSAYWSDAAYIADQVLTLDDLKTFVDTRKPSSSSYGTKVGDNARIVQHEALCALLARRLTRNGRWKEARAYFTKENRKLLDTYITSIRAGHVKSRSRAERAQSFVMAARIARSNGMELLGTELDPDEAIYDGSYGDNDPKAQSKRTGLNGPALKATTDELQRVIAHRPKPMRRWHYRYIAADHAWSAAELMNDDTDQLASWLQEAGMWLAAKDPHAADRFYKAMVRRCGNTALGKEAKLRHWFPAMQQKK